MEDEDLISLAESTWLIEKIGAEEWKEHFFFFFPVCLFFAPRIPGFLPPLPGFEERRGGAACKVNWASDSVPRWRAREGGGGRVGATSSSVLLDLEVNLS